MPWLRIAADFGCLVVVLAVAGIVAGLPLYGLYNPSTGIGRRIYARWPNIMPPSVRARQEAQQRADQAHLDNVTRVRTKEEDLIDAPVNAVVDTGLSESPISGKLTFQSMRRFTANKADYRDTDPDTGQRLDAYQWRIQRNGQVRGQLPKKERGDIAWYLMDNVGDQATVNFVDFLDPKAKQFAQSDQKGRVEIEVPGIDGEWIARDIVWSRVDNAEGDTFAHERDWMLFLTCQAADGSDNWLIYGTRYKGQCKDVLFRSVSFIPEIDVKDVI